MRFQKNEVSKDGFVRQLKSITGDQMINMATMKLQAKVRIQEFDITLNLRSFTKLKNDWTKQLVFMRNW